MPLFLFFLFISNIIAINAAIILKALLSSDIFESIKPVNGTISAKIQSAQIARRAHAFYEPCMSCAKEGYQTLP